MHGSSALIFPMYINAGWNDIHCQIVDGSATSAKVEFDFSCKMTFAVTPSPSTGNDSIASESSAILVEEDSARCMTTATKPSIVLLSRFGWRVEGIAILRGSNCIEVFPNQRL